MLFNTSSLEEAIRSLIEWQPIAHSTLAPQWLILQPTVTGYSLGVRLQHIEQTDEVMERADVHPSTPSYREDDAMTVVVAVLRLRSRPGPSVLVGSSLRSQEVRYHVSTMRFIKWHGLCRGRRPYRNRFSMSISTGAEITNTT